MAAQGHDSQLTSDTPDSRLADALAPAVEAALKRSVQAHPKAWVEAIFPILAPAIRLAVTSALKDTVQMLNQLLENSFSTHSWRWRIEAWRTGKTFAEILLLHSLIYRVEQVLLVDKNSGLLLSSVAAPGVKVKDDALVSAMLIAIQDFIHDSFYLENDEGLREIHAGEFSLWVEVGPRAVIAAAVRGIAPIELRQTLRAAVDLIHEELGAEMQNFQGDTRPLENRCRPILEGCLQSRSQGPQPSSYWRLWLCVAMLGAALAGWVGFRFREAGRWDNALAALRSTPGITITQTGRRQGKYALEGLRDPFAVPVEEVLTKNGVAARDVLMRFQPFLSLDPPVVVRRVRSVIDAPNSVSLSLERDVLTVEGFAPHDWILRARDEGSQLEMLGIRAIGIETLRDRDLETLRSEIEGSRVLFGLGSSAIAPSQFRIIEDDSTKLKRWEGGALAIGRTPQVELIGHTDTSGSDLTNTGLSKQRALNVEQHLIEAGVPADFFVISGAGPSLENADSALRRNVEFRLSTESLAAAGVPKN